MYSPAEEDKHMWEDAAHRSPTAVASAAQGDVGGQIELMSLTYHIFAATMKSDNALQKIVQQREN